MTRKEIEAIAAEAVSSVNEAWRDYSWQAARECECKAKEGFDLDVESDREQLLDRDYHEHKCPTARALGECEHYLYVRPNGYWTIADAQYFQGGPVAAAVPIYTYSAEELADEIERDWDWDDDDDNE